MPNWCVNQLDINGSEQEIVRLIELVKGDEDGFDFSKIVPIPDSPYYAANENQNDFVCGCKKVWVETKPMVGEWGKDGFEKAEGHWEVDGLPIVKELVDSGTIHDSVSAMFGGSDVCPVHKAGAISSQPDWWYNWNVANWGTKWNCGEVWHDRVHEDSKVEGKTSYNFDTAWSPAEPVVHALSGLFPTLTITHRYCEGGMGFAGEVIYHAGNEISRQDLNGDSLPDEAWLKDDDGEPMYGERNYDAVPSTPFEEFCEEHFGGIVGG